MARPPRLGRGLRPGQWEGSRRAPANGDAPASPVPQVESGPGDGGPP